MKRKTMKVEDLCPKTLRHLAYELTVSAHNLRESADFWRSSNEALPTRQSAITAEVLADRVMQQRMLAHRLSNHAKHAIARGGKKVVNQ